MYPRRRQNLGIEGTTVVQVRIGGKSTMVDATVIETSGNAQLDAAALESVRRWKPKSLPPDCLMGGDLVVKVPFRFRLE